MKIQYLILLILLLALYIWGTYCQGHEVNINIHSTDQSAYLNYAKAIHQTDFKYRGSRNRMPAYPSLISFFYKNGMSDQDFFEKAKKINVGISIIVLFIFYIILTKYTCPFDAITAVLFTTFTIFVYKAPYVQAEILFYFLNFLLFVLISNLLSKPTFKTAFLVGLTAGIAHLTKASVLPSLLLCLLSLWVIIGKNIYHKTHTHKSPGKTLWENLKKTFLCSFIIIMTYLIVVFPYIKNSKEHFGKYFYNVNTTFYIWYDSWGDAKKGTLAFGDHYGWPDMPEDKIPGFRKYIREHTAKQIFSRFISGIAKTTDNISYSYGSTLFILIYIIFLSVIFFQNRNNIPLKKDLGKRTVQIFFYIMFFICYFLLYAWYTPIAAGKRFILSLFMPFLFILVRLLTYARQNNLSFSFGSRKIHSESLSTLVLIALALYLLIEFPFQISNIYGGS